MKKAAFKNFAMFTGKLQTCNFIKKRLQHRCFLLNIASKQASKEASKQASKQVKHVFLTKTEQTLQTSEVSFKN